jgi:uncharacterized coiled-coil DUF342 family protein
MTAMGKMLAFLVFILAVAWVVFGVNAYVTRVNWEARALKAEKSAADAAKASNELKALYEVTLAAHADSTRATQAERDRLYQQVAVLAKERDSLQQQFNQAFGNAQQGNVAINNLQVNLKSVQDQIDELDKSVAAKNKEINDLTKRAGDDRVAAGEAQRTATEFRQQADRLSQRLQELNDQIQEYRRQYGTLGPGLGGTPGLPDGFRGTVRSVERGAGGDMLVTLTPGADAGVLKGAVMTVSGVRNGAPVYLGTVQILSTDPKQSVGRFIPPAAANRGVLRADDYPKAGDELKAK